MSTVRPLSTLAQEDISAIARLLGEHGMLPLEEFASVRSEYILDLLKNWSAADAVIICREATLENGFAILQPLPWDTDLLEIHCARLHTFCLPLDVLDGSDKAMLLAMEVRKCIESTNLDLVDYKLSTRNLLNGRFLEAVGFHLVDVLCTLHAPVRGRAGKHEQHIRHAKESDVLPLKELSSQVYGDLSAIQDRFYLEPSIKHENAGRLFAAWFENSYRKQTRNAGVVFVYDEGAGPLGYLAIEKLRPTVRDCAWYDSLNAVSEAARGQGVYKALVSAAFHYLSINGQTDLITKTQISNQRVINSWLHSGANIIESAATYHWTKQL